MDKLIVLIRKELLEQLRTKKILIIFMVFLFVAIASPILAKIMPELLKSMSTSGFSISMAESTNKDAMDQFIKNIGQIALLVMVFVFAGVVSDEKNKKTLEIIMTKPISRFGFIASKFISSFIIVLVAFMFTSAIFYVYTASIFTAFNFTNFLLIAMNVLLYILMIISLTILASTVVRNTIVAGVIGFFSFFVFGTVFGLIESLKGFSPSWIFSNYQLVLANGWSSDLIQPIVFNLCMIAIATTLSVIIFNKQEIDR